MMGFKRNLPFVVSLVSFLVGAAAQSEKCSCAPSTYRFTLDFNSACHEVNGTDSITSAVCGIDVLGDAVTLDLQPVRAISYPTMAEMMFQ
jgi:hypothetical protein